MLKPAITAILSGAILLILGMNPRLIATFRDGMRYLVEQLTKTRSVIPRDQPIIGEVWLTVGGVGLMLVGVLALLLR